MSISAFAGLGDTAPQGPSSGPDMTEAAGLGGSYLTMGLRGLGGYLVGQALAPRAKDKVTYGMIGAACGGTLGVLALGVFAAIALGKRDR